MRKNREPVNRLVNRAITPQRARQLVEIIAGCYDYETSEALIELLAGVVDLAGDDEKADAGLNALMHAFTFTTDFYDGLCSHVARTAKGAR